MPLIEKRNEVKNAPRGGKGDVAFEHLLTPDEMGKSSSLTARLTLPAGAAIGYHMHSGDASYIIYSPAKVCTSRTERLRPFAQEIRSSVPTVPLILLKTLEIPS